MLRCVAAFSHISVCIAGATRTGARRRQQGGAGDFLGQPVGEAGQRCRSCGCDDDRVSPLTEIGVGAGELALEEVRRRPGCW